MRTFVRILYAIFHFLPYIVCEIRPLLINIFREISRFLSFFHVLLLLLFVFVDSDGNFEPFTGMSHFVTGLSRVSLPATLQGDCRFAQFVV